MSFQLYIERVTQKQDLSFEDSRNAFDEIFEGAVKAEDIAAFLLGLKDKGETVDEIRGAATSMRNRMTKITAPANAMDVVGTGGDSHGTLNVSTAAAIVVAACGVPVAKHGNRAASSRSGSSDVLAALGINLEASVDTLQRCLDEANICFMFAPVHHPAMRHVADVRKQLKTRTIFNLLGPLTNPAGVKRHLIGVFSREWLEPMAKVLDSLGSETAWLTHGQDGMDEITTTTATDVVELREGALKSFLIEPEQAGLPRTRLDMLKGGEAEHNAIEMKRLLQGQHGSYRDIVALNAGAALVVGGKAGDVREGARLAEAALDNGAARQTLDKLITITKRKAA